MDNTIEKENVNPAADTAGSTNSEFSSLDIELTYRAIISRVLSYLKTKEDFDNYTISYTKNSDLYKMTTTGNMVETSIEFDTVKPNIKNFNCKCKFVNTPYSVQSCDVSPNGFIYSFIESYACALNYIRMQGEIT